MTRYEVAHLHIFARDLLATTRWYRDMLGADVVESHQSDGEPRVDLLIGGMQIYLADGPRIEQAHGEVLAASPEGMHYGLNHFGLRVADVDAAVADLRAKGADVTFGPKTLRPGVRFAFVEAPDGVTIEILSRDMEIDARPAPSLLTIEASPHEDGQPRSLTRGSIPVPFTPPEPS